MRTWLGRAGLAAALLFVACGGGNKSVRKPDWFGSKSGVVDDNGKWYYAIEKVNGGQGLKRRQAVDKKATDAAAKACADAKPEDVQVIDHYVDADTGSETAVARVDASKCGEGGGSGSGAAKEEAKPAEDAKPAADTGSGSGEAASGDGSGS